MKRRINFSAADADRWRALTRTAAGPGAPAGQSPEWFRITNAEGDDGDEGDEGEREGDDPAVIDIYGEIGMWGVNAADFVAALRGITANNIELHISSGGGSVYESLAIYNALIDHPANVTVYVDSIAASAASFIAQAGDRVIMGRNSELMIHDGLGVTMGNAALHREMADLLDKASDNIASIYAGRAGRVGANVWRQRMKAETWYSAQEAVDAGLADEAARTEKRSGNAPSATLDLSAFNYAGRAKAPAPPVDDVAATPVRPEPDASPEPTSPLVNVTVNGTTDPGGVTAEILAAVGQLMNATLGADDDSESVPADEPVAEVEDAPAPPPPPPPPPPDPEVEDETAVETDDPQPDPEPAVTDEPAEYAIDEPAPVEDAPAPEPEPVAASAGPLILGGGWSNSVAHLLTPATPGAWSDAVSHLTTSRTAGTAS